MVRDLSLHEGTCQRCGVVERLARSGHCAGCQLEVHLLVEAILWKRRQQTLAASLPALRPVLLQGTRTRATPPGWVTWAGLLLLAGGLVARLLL